MNQGLKGRDYITTQEWTLEELEAALSLATELKQMKHRGVPHRYLEGKTLFMLFFDKSTRTRNSFEAGMTQLGGHAHYIDAETSQIAHGESPKDTGIILSRYGHGIAIRHDLIPGEGNTYIRQVAQWADVPVLNMQCDVDHPCQTLADLMTMREHLGHDLRGEKIAVSWAYAPSYAKPLSVPQGLILLLTRYGMHVMLAHPPEYSLMPELVEQARQNAQASGAKFEIVDSMDEAFRDAAVVYPKSWGVLELFRQPEESLNLARKYQDWICDERRMGLTASPVGSSTSRPALYMHCLPADRGHEVADSVIDGPCSIIYDQAENRLHTCKALMGLTM